MATYGPRIYSVPVLSKSPAQNDAYRITFGNTTEKTTESKENFSYGLHDDAVGVNLAEQQDKRHRLKPHSVSRSTQDQTNKSRLLHLIKQWKSSCQTIPAPGIRHGTASNQALDEEAFAKYLHPTRQLLMDGKHRKKGLRIRDNRENSKVEFKAAEVLSSLFPNDNSFTDRVQFELVRRALRDRPIIAASMLYESEQPDDPGHSANAVIQQSPTPRLISSLTDSLQANRPGRDWSASQAPISIRRSLPTAGSDI